MRILHSRDYRVQPWKNGGGVTTEIIASPEGAGFDTFDWRISLARVETAGPFSMFSGIDRSLGLLEGEGVVLRMAGRGEVVLGRDAHAVAFPGDIPVDATLPAGPILDLNVMTRRGRWRHQLSRVAASGVCEIERRGDVTIAVLRATSGSVADQPVDDGDALLLASDAGDQTTKLALRAQGELWIADLWRL